MNTKSFIKSKSNIFHYIEHFNDLWNYNILIDDTPLFCASEGGYFEIVELLLSQEGIEINNKGI